MQSRDNSSASQRLLVSYGAMNTVASMLGLLAFTKLQGLNRFAYDIAVSRCYAYFPIYRLETTLWYWGRFLALKKVGSGIAMVVLSTEDNRFARI